MYAVRCFITSLLLDGPYKTRIGTLTRRWWRSSPPNDSTLSQSTLTLALTLERKITTVGGGSWRELSSVGGCYVATSSCHSLVLCPTGTLFHVSCDLVSICLYLCICFWFCFCSQTISENKLKAFNIGTMNIKKGVTKKEQEDLKKKVCNGIISIVCLWYCVNMSHNLLNMNHSLSSLTTYCLLAVLVFVYRFVGKITRQVLDGLDWIVQCFTSPPTQYRLYGRWLLIKT